MRGPIAIAVLVLGAASALPPALLAQAPEKGSCVTCHEILPDARLSDPVKAYTGDVHAAKGFGCVACHGGDPTVAGMAAMDPAKGYIGKPEREQLASLCGRCHSDAQFMRQYNPSLRVDQEREYLTSVHGQRLMREGDTQGGHVCGLPPGAYHPAALRCEFERAPAEGRRDLRRLPRERGLHGLRTASLRTSRRSTSRASTGPCSASSTISPLRPATTATGTTARPRLACPGWATPAGNAIRSWRTTSRRASTRKVFPMLGVPGCAACHNNHAILRARVTSCSASVRERPASSATSPSRRAVEKIQAMRSLLDSLILSAHRADSLLLRAENSGRRGEPGPVRPRWMRRRPWYKPGPRCMPSWSTPSRPMSMRGW